MKFGAENLRIRAEFHIIPIMRTPIDISSHLIDQATLFAPSRIPRDAVEHLLEDYPRLVSELRLLRRRVAEFDRETADFDERLSRLQDACRQLLDL